MNKEILRIPKAIRIGSIIIAAIYFFTQQTAVIAAIAGSMGIYFLTAAVMKYTPIRITRRIPNFQ